jgi:hypothetical protein
VKPLVVALPGEAVIAARQSHIEAHLLGMTMIATRLGSGPAACRSLRSPFGFVETQCQRRPSVLVVGGPGFEPEASRCRTAIAIGSQGATRGRLGSLRPRLKSTTCRYMPTDAAQSATRVAIRFSAIVGQTQSPQDLPRDDRCAPARSPLCPGPGRSAILVDHTAR